MLQQTTVATALPFFERFIARFPTVSTLADAAIDEVIALWAGLGYYRRAHHLHTAAIIVRDQHAGRVPDDLDALLALPGIGRSTAGAILALAFDRPFPILDGNVRRILCRLFAFSENPRNSRGEKQLWRWAEQLTPQKDPHDYTQAIMDLGATICTPRAPNCTLCPLSTLCLAYQQGIAEALPISPPRKTVPLRRQLALLVEHEGNLLLQQRPSRGLLPGLWEFPGTDLIAALPPAQQAANFLGQLGGKEQLLPLGRISHTYSHFKLELHIFLTQVNSSSLLTPQRFWIPRNSLAEAPLHGAHRKACKLLPPPGSTVEDV